MEDIRSYREPVAFGCRLRLLSIVRRRRSGYRAHREPAAGSLVMAPECATRYLRCCGDEAVRPRRSYRWCRPPTSDTATIRPAAGRLDRPLLRCVLLKSKMRAAPMIVRDETIPQYRHSAAASGTTDPHFGQCTRDYTCADRAIFGAVKGPGRRFQRIVRVVIDPMHRYAQWRAVFLSHANSGPHRLRELLTQPSPILAPGAFDCFSARLIEAAGFP